jgi:hypothetical protein
MSMEDYLGQLGRLHGFTLEELRANERGEVHPAQLRRGRRKGRVAIAVLALLGGVCLLAGWLGAAMFRDSLGADASDVDLNGVQAVRWHGLAAAAFFSCCAGVAISRRRALQAAFASAQIQVVAGPVQKVHVRGRGVPDRYILRVGPRSVDVSRSLWELLTHGATYRLHYVADELLSLAPVHEDPLERAEFERERASFARSLHVEPSRRV